MLAYKKKGKIVASVFIDGNSVKYMEAQNGWSFETNKLLDYFRKEYDLKIHQVYWYLSLMDKNEERDFIKKLRGCGYIIREKIIKEITDCYTENLHYKKSVEVDMVIDIFNTVDEYDLAIIVSGSENLERAVELLRCKNTRIFVICTEGVIAKELKNAADTYLDINTLKDYVLDNERNTKRILTGV